MKKPHAPSVREVLQLSRDGLTVAQIHKLLPSISKTTVLRKVLEERMPDAYIDRWIKGLRGQYEAVWMIVDVPSNCPHPKNRFKPKTQWVKISSNSSVLH